MAVTSPTSRVFLDTEVFVRAQFNYRSAPFGALLSHIEAGRVHLFLTDLTVREIKANLAEAVAEALKRLSSSHKAAAVISKCPSAAGLFGRPDKTAIEQEAHEALDQFLASCKPTVLPVKDEYLKPVLDAYFSRQPPFCDSKEKAQFPDALAIAALTDDAKHDRTICTVSGDEAFRYGCSPLYHLVAYETLPSFLDAVASEDTRSDFIHEAIPRLDEAVAPIIKDEFEQLPFDLYREWGDVQSVSVEDISFSDHDVDILSLERDSATVLERATIRFKASVEHVFDIDNFATDHFTVTRTVVRNVLVTLKTDYQRAESVEVDSAGLFDHREVLIHLDDVEN
jgi:PIN domain